MLAKPKPTLKIKIKGKTWKVFFLSNKQFTHWYPKSVGADALTTYQHDQGFREIVFLNTVFRRSTVVHELMHAYLSYRCLQGLSYGQIEEIVCDVAGLHLTTMQRLADLICSKFKQR